MHAIAYCQDKAAPPGSSVYYAIRMAPAAVRVDLLAVHAYYREIMAVPVEVSDPNVAAAKLQWWREELERILRGQATHPAGLLLQEAITRHRLPEEPFRHILEAASMDLDYGAYPSFQALSTYCHHSGGALTRLLVAISGQGHAGTEAFAHDLGVALTLSWQLGNLRRDARAGRVYLPEDEMRAAGVHRETLLGNRTPAPLRRLLADHAQRIEQLFDRARGQLGGAARSAQRSQLVLAALRRALLREMARDDFPLLEQGYELTPIRKLWIAWRTARQAR